MDVTELGMVISVSPVQPTNIPLLMVVTEFGIVTPVKLVQFSNA